MVCVLAGAGCSGDGPTDAGTSRMDAGRPCAADFDCRGGEICREDLCREACAEDDPCMSQGTTCALELGYCVPGCAGPAECAANEDCVLGRCRPAPAECSETEPCPGGERCVEGRCEPIDGGFAEDGGLAADGGADSGALDSGTRDAGGLDAGDVSTDGGGPIGSDSGTPTADAGGTDPDGGPPVGVDAGESMPDAGAQPCEITGCPSTQRCCDGSCVNREVPVGTDGRSDGSFLHCGGCGMECDVDRASACSRPSGSPRCMCGSEELCPEGQLCVIDGGSFTCTDPSSDPDNCGSVGHACAAGETCEDGMCRCGEQPSCGSGLTCCGGGCVDTTSNLHHCGGCFASCAPYGDRCEDSACHCGSGDVCPGPSDSDLGEICCGQTCTTQDDSNCGSCGNMCDSGYYCTESSLLAGRACCADVIFQVCFL